MSRQTFDALVLAAGRGANDPMARASGVSHKCLLPVAGVPMLVRVLEALVSSSSVGRIFISIEAADIIAGAQGLAALGKRKPIETIASAARASSSVGEALRSGSLEYPVLVTTADHALLTPGIVDDFCRRSRNAGADLTAGLADAETILSAYPGAARTFLKFSDARYSGCNLFTFNAPTALAAVDFWQRVERDRKQPWRLIGAFGVMPLLIYLSGRASLAKAFEVGSKKLGVTARPIVMPLAEAAIDVDKPADLELVERILAGRTK
jgi:GTP:adenosylcobinamide-phosphate guanylyltransferase